MKVLLVGCGHMGTTLLKCFEKNSFIQEIVIVDLVFQSDIHRIYRSLEQVDEMFDLMVLGVRPQTYENLIKKQCGRYVVSIMACVAGARLQNDFPNAHVVRVMPNMGIRYGQGLSTICSFSTDCDRELITRLLEGTGKFIWVSKEEDLDVLTIFNGCGPGLLLGILQVFINICHEFKISKTDAEMIMRQTFVGTSSMLEHSQESVKKLVDSIATKGGVTEACLEKLLPDLPDIIKSCVNAGIRKQKLY